MAVSGVLLSWFPQGGWHYLFYFYGTMSSVWIVVWWCIGYSSPLDHPHLSDKERAYLSKYHEDAKLQVCRKIIF